MRRMNYARIGGLVMAAALAIGGLTACDDNSGRAKETKSNQSNYDKLVANQPGHGMNYSPTRETINFWADTWGKRNKLSYVYLMNANGDFIGYYVFKGLPVTYCAALKPTVAKDNDDSGGNLLVPQPGIDGVYYSGGQCNSYYGKDASTGAYVEYTAGMGINVLLYDQPLPGHPNVPPLGQTKIKN